MRSPSGRRSATIDTRISFWPSFVDILISFLMVLMLSFFLRAASTAPDQPDPPDREAQAIRDRQALFEVAFRREFNDQPGIEIKPGLNMIQITFSDAILFARGEYLLIDSAKPVLDRCAEVFRNASEARYQQIQVEGHTDNLVIKGRTEFPRDNWELSVARAVSVTKYLIERTRLNEKLFSANGYSEFQPLPGLPNDPRYGQPKNRRIEIRVFFDTPRQQP